MLITTILFILSGCTDVPQLFTSDTDPIGVPTATIVQIETELNAAYELWEEEEYEQAFIALDRLNQEGMHSVWPVLRAGDAESTLHLEVQFGKVLWATEQNKSIANNEAARSLKSLLLRELNDVRLMEPVSNPEGEPIKQR